MARRSVAVACAAALAIGLFFIFAWAPHPWGWEGFDDYHAIARTILRGEPYPTIDRPWGYAYFLATLYRIAGDRPVVPLVVQTAFNALLPLVVFEFARVEFDERVAVVAALLTGFFSFNTVYASTQASDSLCTVMFTAAVLLVASARRRQNGWLRYAVAGLLLGIATQFRPNLIFVPLLIAIVLVLEQRTRLRLRGAAIVVAISAIALVPWTVRNARLTGELLPTSTHGGMQLWYGTLQTGPYLASRAHNPRSVFETATFPYTSLDRVPPVVTGRLSACATGDHAALVYWTDRNPQHQRTPLDIAPDNSVRAEMAAAAAPTTYYFYVDGATAPRDPAPSVFFVTGDHLGDVDRHEDLLDVFDVVRLLRHAAWNEPVPAADRLDFDGDRRLTDIDVRRAASVLLAHASPPVPADPQARIEAGLESATLSFADGSKMTVPRVWSARVTDLAITGGSAAALLHTTVPFGRLRRSRDCVQVEDLAVNAVYYRSEPQAMRRYFALAFDNIRRDPRAYAASVAYRAVRVFFIEGSEDPHTTYQFAGSSRIYRLATVASLVFLALFAAGVAAAYRRGAAIALPLALILYIPATLAFVLTNMRYSVTVQPLMFIFVAAALITAWESAAGARRRGGIETARQP